MRLYTQPFIIYACERVPCLGRRNVWPYATLCFQTLFTRTVAHRGSKVDRYGI